jgi:hypothetical protein
MKLKIIPGTVLSRIQARTPPNMFGLPRRILKISSAFAFPKLTTTKHQLKQLQIKYKASFFPRMTPQNLKSGLNV